MPGDFIEPGSTCICGNSSYAEYKYLHRHKGAFVFERTGIYRLRAVARIDGREVISNEVTVTVQKRPPQDLKRIAALGELSEGLGFRSLRATLPEKLLSVKSVEGNIGNSIDCFRVLQEFVTTGQLNGHNSSRDDFVAACKRRFDPVSYENALLLLSGHYMQRQNTENLSAILEVMPYDSDARRDRAAYLKRRLAGPNEIVDDNPCLKTH